MPDKNDYYEFLYAYSLGCLDEDDLINFKNFLNSDEDYYWQELGEFQNLSSLLPSILPVEKPDPEVKDKVARKLYRIRNEIKAKRDKLKKGLKAPEAVIEKVIEPPKEEILPEEKQQEATEDKQGHNVEDFEIVTSKEKIPENLIPSEEEKEEQDINKEKKSGGEVLNFEKKPEILNDIDTDITTKKNKVVDSVAEEPSPTKNAIEKSRKHKQSRIRQIEKQERARSRRSLLSMMAFLAMLILVLIFGYLYFKFSSSTKGYEARINSLNQNLSELNERFSQNKDLQAVLSSRNLKTVKLSGTDIAKDAFGKLFISLDTNHGFIQVSDLPTLKEGEVYQLWIYIYDNYMLLAKFNPTDNPAYVPFDTPQLSEDSKVSFILTRELSNGILQPGKEIYMTGSFQ
jgi:predicted nucleic acid-binding Zn ribbon protein